MATTNTVTAGETYQAAVDAARAAEAKGSSARTLNAKWKAVFAAEDALRASGAWS